MSFGGHALDAIIRIKNNRALIQMHKDRFSRYKDAINNTKSKHYKFTDRSQLSEKELTKYKKIIRQKIAAEKVKILSKSIIVTLIVVVIIYIAAKSMYNYFIN